MNQSIWHTWESGTLINSQGLNTPVWLNISNTASDHRPLTTCLFSEHLLEKTSHLKLFLCPFEKCKRLLPASCQLYNPGTFFSSHSFEIWNQGRQHPYVPVALQDEKPNLGGCHLAKKRGLMTEKNICKFRSNSSCSTLLLINTPTDIL